MSSLEQHLGEYLRVRLALGYKLERHGEVLSDLIAYLQALAASPEFARAFLIEVLGAGPEALSRRAAVQERFAAQLRDVHRRARADIPEIPEVPPYTFRAAVGAVTELVTVHVLERGAQTLPELAGAVLDVQLALLVGRQVAQELAARAGG